MRAQNDTAAVGKVVRGGVECLPDRYPLWLRVSFWICIVIAVAAVVRRGVALVATPSESGPRDLAELDAYFVSHAALTWAHISSALVFVSLLPFLFWRRTRGSRRLENAFLLLGLIVGLTAYAMSVHAVGGWVERSAVLLFNTLFLLCLSRAFVLRRSGDAAGKRQWMFRAVAIVLGIAVTRPVMGVFFATSRLTHWTEHQFFGVAFWIGFSLSTLTAEVWLRKSKFAASAILS